MLTSEQVQRDFHYLFPQEVPALKVLALNLPPEPLIINIGAGAGTSGLLFAETRPDCQLVTIDITDLSSPFGCLEAERDVMQRAGLEQWRWTHHSQYHVDSKWAAKTWLQTGGFSIKPLADMIFVDGDHTYEGCKGDIEGWMPHLAPGGIMAVHDFEKERLAPNPDGPHPLPWPGVSQAVHELLIPNFYLVLHVDSLVAFRK